MSHFFQPHRAGGRRPGQLVVGKSKHQRTPFLQAGLLTALLLSLSLFSFIFSPTSYASGGSYINWDSTMIYAGQNNGNPLGPVGEPAAVHGLLYSGVNTQLVLVLVPGDATLDINTCNTGQISLGSVTTDATGQFDFNFKWPASASSGSYSICALDAISHTPVINQDGGPFSVLSPNSPTLTQDVSKVTSGGTVTISGQNWLPPQPITVRIGKCAACGAPGATLTSIDTTSTGTNGSFSVTLTVPDGTTPGNYVIDAISKRGNPLDAYYINGPLSLKVQAAAIVPPADTATPTSTVTPTATATAVTKAVATQTPVTNKIPIDQPQATSTLDKVLTLPVVIGGAAALLLLIVIIVGFVMLLRSSRRRRQKANPGPNYPQAAFTNYPPMYPMPQPGNFAQNAAQPSMQPFVQPVAQPPAQPTAQPSMQPFVQPVAQPSAQPAAPVQQTVQPAALPAANPITPITPPAYQSRQGQTPLPQSHPSTVISPLLPAPGSNPVASSGIDPHAPVGYCASCGTPFVRDTQFCGECGKSVTNLSANQTRAENA